MLVKNEFSPILVRDRHHVVAILMIRSRIEIKI